MALFALVLFMVMNVTPVIIAQPSMSEEKKKKMYGFDPAGAFAETPEQNGKSENKGRLRKAGKRPPTTTVTPRLERNAVPAVKLAVEPALQTTTAPNNSAPQKQPADSTADRRVWSLALIIIITLILLVLVAMVFVVVKLIREYGRVKAENGQNRSRNLASIAHK
jgi:hypothetical protein